MTLPIANPNTVTSPVNAASSLTLSWVFTDPDPGAAQTAYRLYVQDGGAVVIDTGKVTSSSTSYTITGGTLVNAKHYTWYVYVWDDTNAESTSAPLSTFVTGSAPNTPTLNTVSGLINPQVTLVFSWNFSDPDTGQAQGSYRLIVKRTSDNVVIYDTNKTSGAGQSAVVPANTFALGTQYSWTVQTWDDTDLASPVSTAATFTTSNVSAPTLNAFAAIDATLPYTFTWVFHDPDTGDTQSAFELAISQALTGVQVYDSGKLISVNSHLLLNANILQNGIDYTWQVRTWDSVDTVGPYSAQGTFLTSAAPIASITYPAHDGDSVASTSVTVLWTMMDLENKGQSQYRIQLILPNLVLNTYVTILDTGIVSSTTARSYPITGLISGNTYTLYLTVWDGDGVASTPVQRTFTINTTPPPEPSITIAAYPRGGPALQVVIANPAPDPGVPDAASNSLYRKLAGETVWTRIATGLPPNGRFTDWTVPLGGTLFQYYAEAVADSGTLTDCLPAVGRYRYGDGLYLHDVSDPEASLVNLQYDEARQETASAVVVLTQFVGRARPVANFSEQGSRVVQADVTIPKNDGSLTQLTALFERQTIVCYRDQRGRRIFGIIKSLPIKDEFGYSTCSISVEEVDYMESV